MASKGFIFTFLAAIAWAISIVLLKVILQNGEDAYNVLFWTTLFGLPFYLLLFAKNRAETKRLKKKDIQILFAIGIISSVGVVVTEFLAIKYSPAINYAFLIRTVLLFTFLFAYLFLGERFSRQKLILATLLLIGAYLLTTNGKIISLSLGDIFTLTQAALIALGNNVLGKLATNRMSTALSASASYLIGFVPKLLIALLFTHIVIPEQLFAIFCLSVVYILLIQLRFEAYKNASASYVTMVFSFTPVFVSFMAIPLLGETMTPVQIIGGILIIFAGAIVARLKI